MPRFDRERRGSSEARPARDRQRVVGLVPKAALKSMPPTLLRKINKPDFAPEAELVHIANKNTGLSELAPFDAQKKVVEYAMSAPRPLAQMTVEKFIERCRAMHRLRWRLGLGARWRVGAGLTAMVAGYLRTKKTAS